MRLSLTASLFATGVLAAASALAVETTTNFDANHAPGGAHYNYAKGAPNPQPTCRVAGFTVTCDGTVISGVGNTDADVVYSVSYSGKVTCTNKGRHLVVPHTTTTITGVAPDPVTTIKNGTMTVDSVSFGGDPSGALEGSASCPNDKNWTKEASDVTMTSFSYKLIFDGYSPNAAITITGP